MADARVSVAYANMCQFGMTSHIDVKDGPRGPVAKPTGFLTSGWAMVRALSRRCRDGHAYVPLVGGRASACQQYPPALCEAMCRGIAKQKAYEAGGDIVTGALDRKMLCSLMSRVVDPIRGRKIRVHCNARAAARSIGEWNEYWIDNVHEADGGCDAFGTRIGDGTAEMRKQIDSLCQKPGVI